MIETLMNLQPLLLIAMLMIMYSLGSFKPYLAKPANKKKHDLNNLGINLISFSINGLFYLGHSLNPPTLHLPWRAVPGENVGYTKNKF